MVLGTLAQGWGWHAQGIQAAIAVRDRDELQVRFPLVYHDAFNTAAKEHNVDINWAYAIARQESAFVPDARSPAGAMGVMQLLPSTAKSTARNVGVTLSADRQLFEPETNIRLGTAHLNELMQRFGHNRILATAAYNAGPGRVHQWMANGGDLLPYDIWIETVPFHETRNYIQNVMTFSVIYGYRRGKQPRVLVENEIACVCIKR
jgi:soluble lytic murein transglycosylase